MIDILILLVSWALMITGCVFVVTGAVGIIRMPDLFTRLHAASLTDTGGTLFIGLALIVQAVFVFDNHMAAIKMTLIIFFALFTSPTASHALAKTALLCGQVPSDAKGKPILESPEHATLLARSRPADYRHGQDAKRIAQQMHALDKKREDRS